LTNGALLAIILLLLLIGNFLMRMRELNFVACILVFK